MKAVLIGYPFKPGLENSKGERRTATFNTYDEERAQAYADQAAEMNPHDDLNSITWPDRDQSRPSMREYQKLPLMAKWPAMREHWLNTLLNRSTVSLTDVIGRENVVLALRDLLDEIHAPPPEPDPAQTPREFHTSTCKCGEC